MNLSIKILTIVFILMILICNTGCNNRYYAIDNTLSEIQNSIKKSTDDKKNTNTRNFADEHTKNEEIKSINLEQIWKSEVEISYNTKPVFDGEDIFVGSRGFTCLDRNTGKIKWYQEKAYLGFVQGNYYDNEMISYVNLGVIYVLDRNTGKILYQEDMMEEVNCTTVIANGALYYLERGCLNALDLKSKKELWFFVPKNFVPASFDSNMVIYNNSIIYETLGRILAVDLDNREAKWDTGKIGAQDAPIIIWENNVYVLSHEGKIFAINAHDGRIIWKKEVLPYDMKKYYSFSNTQIKDGRIFFSVSNGHIYGMNLYSGEVILDFLFKGEEKYAITDIAIHNNRLFYISDSNIYSIDLSGNDITVYNTGIPVEKRLAIQDGEFCFIGEDSYLYKYNPNE